MNSDVSLAKLLPRIPGSKDIGLTGVSDGPPLPKSLNVMWPSALRDMMKKNWPGTPFPRSWGEKVVKKMPLGLGEKVIEFTNSFQL